MSNVATALVRIAMLAGGAAVGALLARVADQWLVSHSQEQSEDHHKTRYAQGLGPLAPEIPLEGHQGYQIYQDYQEHQEHEE